MANPDRPRGFEAWGKVLRETPYIAGADVKPGDMLVLQTDGKVDPVDTGGASYATKAIGVATGIAADGEEVMVYDHPDQLYVAQADGADIAAQTDLGLNYAILATTASSQFDASRMEVDSNTGANTNTLPLKVLSVDKSTDNALGAQVDVVAKINNHQLVADAGSTTGA